MYKKDIEYQYPLDIKTILEFVQKNEKFFLFSLNIIVFFFMRLLLVMSRAIYKNPFDSHISFSRYFIFCTNYCEILFHMILSLAVDYQLEVLNFSHFVSR